MNPLKKTARPAWLKDRLNGFLSPPALTTASKLAPPWLYNEYQDLAYVRADLCQSAEAAYLKAGDADLVAKEYLIDATIEQVFLRANPDKTEDDWYDECTKGPTAIKYWKISF